MKSWHQFLVRLDHFHMCMCRKRFYWLKWSPFLRRSIPAAWSRDRGVFVTPPRALLCCDAASSLTGEIWVSGCDVSRPHPTPDGSRDRSEVKHGVNTRLIVDKGQMLPRFKMTKFDNKTWLVDGALLFLKVTKKFLLANKSLYPRIHW